MRRIVSTLTALFSVGFISAQNTAQDVQLNTITTAVPFLQIAPDSRSGAMGDVGVAVSPDASALHWNPAKLAFADKDFGVTLGYSPWLRKLVNDISLAYLGSYKVLNNGAAIGASLRYFSLGEIDYTDQNGQLIRSFTPNEFAIDFAYSKKLSERLSMGVSGRYIYSNLTGGVPVNSAETKPGQSVAADISMYYTKDEMTIGDKNAEWAFGLNISNIGTKMSYTDDVQRDFIPTNLRLGQALTIHMDDYNKLTIATDINKLLVPTPPVYRRENGAIVEVDGKYDILSGKDPNVGVATAIFNSFSDAPGIVTEDANGEFVVENGSRFKEELREINLSGGLEYWYANQFVVRGGYFYEHATKGNRQFFTLGAGLVYNVFGLDLSYLISTTTNNPLANTLRFTLSFNFDELGGGSSKSSSTEE